MENYKKQIKDLKERNHKLKHQYELQQIKLHSVVSKNERLKEEIDQLNSQLKDYSGRCLKVEKYIDHHYYDVNVDFKNYAEDIKLLVEGRK